MRGFLYCPHCHKRLSGSGSQGRFMKYYYYHCKCGYRIRADKVNGLFLDGISNLSVSSDYIELYKEVLRNIYHELFQEQTFDQGQITKSLEKLMERAVKGKELLIRGEIDHNDYLAIKSDCEKQIGNLGRELNNIYMLGIKNKAAISDMVKRLSDPSSLFTTVDVIYTRELISLLLKEDLIFDEECFCNNMSEAAKVIYSECSVHDDKEIIQSILLQLNNNNSFTYHRNTGIENQNVDNDAADLSFQILKFLVRFAKIEINNVPRT